ncbi:Aspartate ammonia-lyase [Minicystis rosea]|nr:Aspartate ammonia-lyase [Minicystis rosea]
MSEAMATSKPVRVTLFEDRAEVTRAARVSIAAGSAWVSIAGVSPFVDERSVQARLAPNGEAAGDVRVIAARVRWIVHLERVLGREQIDALEATARRAEHGLVEARQALDRAGRAEARAEALRSAWIAGVSAVPRRAREAPVLASWSTSLRSIEEATAAALAEAATARAARSHAEDELARARAALAQGQMERPRYEAVLEVELQSAAARDVEIEVTYRVPCALWRPEHLVRLASSAPPQGQSAPLEIVTFATAWQCTGEVWDGVEVRFSTARPARAASPPLLTDDVLHSRRKTDEERRRVEVSMREQAVQVAGLERGTRAVDEMPGMDDGGEPLLFVPKGKVSIASDGRPFRVEVQRATVPAKIERVLFPEVAEVAHLRATATLTKGGPLLAGPIRVARGQSLVGRAKIDFVGKGEPFEIGLGVDDGVRVRREIVAERDVTAVIGTQKRKQRVWIFLSNLSNEPKRVLVTERIPVSEIEDVTVTLTEAGGFVLEGKDGFLRRDVDLGPHETTTLGLCYEMKAGAKVVLPI